MPSAMASRCFVVFARFEPFFPFLPLASLSAGVAVPVAVPDGLLPSSKLPSPGLLLVH